MAKDIAEHEHEWVNSGLVFATVDPLREQGCIIYGERRFQQDEPPDNYVEVDLKCNIDGGAMQMAKMSESKVRFLCTTCDQIWNYEKSNGEIRSSCTILGSLWPSRMEEGSQMWRERYLPYWMESQKHKANALYSAGFYTKGERDELVAGSKKEIEQALQANPVPHPKSRWDFRKRDPLKAYR